MKYHARKIVEPITLDSEQDAYKIIREGGYVVTDEAGDEVTIKSDAVFIDDEYKKLSVIGKTRKYPYTVFGFLSWLWPFRFKILPDINGKNRNQYITQLFWTRFFPLTFLCGILSSSLCVFMLIVFFGVFVSAFLSCGFSEFMFCRKGDSHV